MSTSGSKAKFLVAVDFGTTYSGIGWVNNLDPDTSFILKDWPNSVSSDEKVPTTLKYDNGSYRWGFQIESNEKRHEWFKLKLYPDQKGSDLSKKYPSGTSIDRPIDDNQRDEIIVDYLTSLREHAEQKLDEMYSRASALKKMKREYVLTVPAVWSDKARNLTKLLAERAGMGKNGALYMITEPEAAGIWALKALADSALKAGDTFVMCDAGGGTVDLISYTVDSLGSIPEIHEAAPGSGQLCGSSFLNRIFDEALRKRLRNYTGWTPEHHSDAMQRFEQIIKRNFDGDLHKKYLIPARGLRNSLKYRIDGGTLEMSGQEISDVFEPVVAEIVKLVKEQILATRKLVSVVLMAGGFGRNKFLQRRLKEAIGQRISVVPEANTAIIRGALLGTLAEKNAPLASIRIASRKARKHYGINHFAPYIHGEHDKTKKEKDPLTGTDRISVMSWFLKKGSTLEESDTVKIQMYVDQEVSDRTLIVPMDVYTCEDESDNGAPRYLDNSVSKLTKLTADLTGVPKDKLNKERGKDGKLYYKVDFEFEMTSGARGVTFALVHDGKKYNVVQEFI